MTFKQPIPFTQYIAPFGRKHYIEINMPDEVAIKAYEIINQGFRFECEVLATGDVSLTIHDAEKGEDVGIEVVPNGPEVPDAVTRLVNKFQGKVS